MQSLQKLALSAAMASSVLIQADPFLDNIRTRVIETVEQSPDIPSDLKEGLVTKFALLVKNGVLEETGTDAQVRPYFVTLQGVIEQVLSQELGEEISSLTSVIHTPAPTTPLCTKGEISPELVDPSIQEDPNRLYTVKARTTIVRDFLQKGGHLYVVYPEAGFYKRSEEQREIYQEAITQFPTTLHNSPLNCESIDPNHIGAFYLFESAGKTYAFAIKMTQANAPQGHGNYNLWFSELENSPGYERISTIWDSLKPNLTSEIPISKHFKD